jgi:hypothetical protein
MCQTCPMHPVFCEVREVLVSKLKEFTFEKIIEKFEEEETATLADSALAVTLS